MTNSISYYPSILFNISPNSLYHDLTDLNNYCNICNNPLNQFQIYLSNYSGKIHISAICNSHLSKDPDILFISTMPSNLNLSNCKSSLNHIKKYLILK